jgi:hypothetical protein
MWPYRPGLAVRNKPQTEFPRDLRTKGIQLLHSNVEASGMASPGRCCRLGALTRGLDPATAA